MFDEVEGYVEGEMSIPSARNTKNISEPDFNTLDEPIRDTIVKKPIFYSLLFVKTRLF